MSSILYIFELGLEVLAAVEFVIASVDPHIPKCVFCFSIRQLTRGKMSRFGGDLNSSNTHLF